MNRPNPIMRIGRATALFASLVAAIALCATGPSAAATSGAPKADPGYDAAFVSQTVPSFIELFTPTAVSVTMRNTGTATWYKSDVDVFLATAEPQDNYYWCIQDNRYGIYSGNRVLLPHDVAPGEDVRFDFVVKPLSCFFRATSPFRFRMLSPLHGTFGDETPDPGVYVSIAAEFVSQQVPEVIPARAHLPGYSDLQEHDQCGVDPRGRVRTRPGGRHDLGRPVGAARGNGRAGRGGHVHVPRGGAGDPG